MKNYYKILGIGKDASQKEIKSAYRSLAKKHHPDVTGKKNDEQFKNIQEAYSTLSNPEKRSNYDAYLGASVQVHIKTSNARKSHFVRNISPEPLIPRNSIYRDESFDPFRSSFFNDADDLFERLRSYFLRRFFFDDDAF